MCDSRWAASAESILRNRGANRASFWVIRPSDRVLGHVEERSAEARPWAARNGLGPPRSGLLDPTPVSSRSPRFDRCCDHRPSVRGGGAHAASACRTRRRQARGEPIAFPPITEEERAARPGKWSASRPSLDPVFCQVEAAMKWREALEAAGAVYKRTASG